MTNLIYRCGQSGHFFLNLSTFFQFSKRGRERLPLPPSTCAPVYYKIKEKTEEKRSWKCLRLPFTLQGKAFFKKISWSKISQLVIFFSALQKWSHSQILLKEFDQIYSSNIYWTTIFRNSYSNRKLSVTASGITKIFKL